MRRKLVLGLGLAALVGGSAAGQFASERTPPVGTPKAAAPTIGGFQPAAPTTSPIGPASPTRPTLPTSPGYTPLYGPAPTGAYVPPTDGLRPPTTATPSMYGSATPAGGYRPAASFTALPVDTELPTALPKDHPWLVKAEHGAWFILVKSYVRPAAGSKAELEDKGLTARQLGEGLASEIRDTFRVQAFLYEYISEERKAEQRALIAQRQKAANEYVTQLAALEQKAKLQGMDFLLPDNKIRIMRHDSRDHIGVLVGGFQTEADALKALGKLKTWPAPKNEMLMDGGAIVQPGANGKQEIVKTRLNPYTTAFVVGNPVTTRAAQPTAPRQAIDDFVKKLNEDNPYSLLKATKGWTLGVKSFSAPVEIVNKNSDTSLMRKFGMSKGGDALAKGGEQAEAMAKAIRALRGPSLNGQPGAPLNLEAFVLHTRTASLVTIGQFEGPDDPQLHATTRLLTSIKVNVSEDQLGTRPAMNAPSLFDSMLPIPIPKP